VPVKRYSVRKQICLDCALDLLPILPNEIVHAILVDRVIADDVPNGCPINRSPNYLAVDCKQKFDGGCRQNASVSM